MRRMPTYVLAAAIALVAVSAGVAGIVLGLRREADRPAATNPNLRAGNFAIGQSLPDFELAPLDEGGASFRLSRDRDAKRFLVINFHSPDCPCAENCAKLVNEMMAEGFGNDVQIVGILPGNQADSDVKERVRAQAADGAVAFPVFVDRDRTVERLLGARRTPEIWILDREGRIVFWGAPENTLFPGTSNHRYLLREAIVALRQGRRPDVQAYPPLGCPIEG